MGWQRPSGSSVLVSSFRQRKFWEFCWEIGLRFSEMSAGNIWKNCQTGRLKIKPKSNPNLSVRENITPEPKGSGYKSHLLQEWDIFQKSRFFSWFCFSTRGTQAACLLFFASLGSAFLLANF